MGCGWVGCGQCRAPLPDGSRRAFAEHCRVAHPKLYEAASRSDEWDDET